MRVHGSAVLSLFVLAGCGGGDSAALKSNEPWGDDFVREQVVCDGGGEIALSFTLTDVTVTRGGDALASASLEGRRLSRDCESAAAADVRSSTHWSVPVYENTDLACRVPARIAIQANPIMERNKPSGTTLLVLDPDRGDLVASVPLKAGGSRLYYDTSLCTRSS